MTEGSAERLAALPVATISDATGGHGILPPHIRQITPGVSCGGPAYPITLAAGDNLGVHQALDRARRGSVIVAAVDGEPAHGLWGEIASAAACGAGIRGFVTDGHVRDVSSLLAHGVGVFARGSDPRKAHKRTAGTYGEASFGAVAVRPGDVVVCDADGVIVVPADEASAVALRAQAVSEAEARVREGIRAGRSTLELLQLTVNAGDEA